jgi:hypothetical protein
VFVTIIEMTIYKPKLKAKLVYYRIITVLLSCSSSLEARAAVNGSVGRRLESELSLAAALAAGSDKVLSLASLSILLLVAASLAALRLILEALFSIESLLTCCKYELLTAISAGKSNILVYYFSYLFNAFNFYFILAHVFLPRFDV